MRYIANELDVLRHEKLDENDWNSNDAMKRMRWLNMEIFNNNAKLSLREVWHQIGSYRRCRFHFVGFYWSKNGPNSSKSNMDLFILKS